MTKLYAKFATARHFARNDSGATAIEYGLIAGGISIIIIAAVALAGPALQGTFEAIAEALGAEVPASS